MQELIIVLIEVILILFSLYKGERWLRTTSFIHIFLVLALTKKLGTFFGYQVNINSMLYGTFFILQHLIYTYYSKESALQTVTLTLYAIFVIIVIGIAANPLPIPSGQVGAAISIYPIAKIMGTVFCMIYFSQMLFLALLDNAKKLNWYKYLGINTLVQGLQFLAALPMVDNKQMSFRAFIFRVIYITLLFPVVNWFAQFRKEHRAAMTIQI